MLYNNKTKTRQNFGVKSVFMWAQNAKKCKKALNINDLQAKMSLEFTQKEHLCKSIFHKQKAVRKSPQKATRWRIKTLNSHPTNSRATHLASATF